MSYTRNFNSQNNSQKQGGLTAMINALYDKLDEGKRLVGTDFISLKKLYSIVTSERKKEKNYYQMDINELNSSMDYFSGILDSIIKLRSNDKVGNDVNTLNEIMQLVISELKQIMDSYKEETSKTEEMREKVFEADVGLLGYAGTKVNDLPIQYIEKIVHAKIRNNEKRINSEDVLSLLTSAFDIALLGKNLGDGSKTKQVNLYDYQKLINSTLIPVIDKELNGNIELINNPKVLEIINDLAFTYETEADFEKVQQLYEKVLQLKQFEDEYEYKRIKEKKNEVAEVMSEFSPLDINSMDAIENIMSKIFPIKDAHEGHKKGRTAKYIYKMSGLKKLYSILCVVKMLREDKEINPEGVKISIGKMMCGLAESRAYKGYIIMPIYGTNICLLENFNDKENNAIFVGQSDNLMEAISSSKQTIKKQHGFVDVRHTRSSHGEYSEKLLSVIKNQIKIISRTSEIDKSRDGEHGKTVSQIEKNILHTENLRIQIEEDLIRKIANFGMKEEFSDDEIMQLSEILQKFFGERGIIDIGNIDDFGKGNNDEENDIETDIDSPTETAIETIAETNVKAPKGTVIEVDTETDVETDTGTVIEAVTETDAETDIENDTKIDIENEKLNLPIEHVVKDGSNDAEGEQLLEELKGLISEAKKIDVKIAGLLKRLKEYDASKSNDPIQK